MSELYVRAFPAVINQPSANQLTGRFVPYGVVADVADPLPNGRFDLYREGFRRGAFERQAESGSKNKGVFTKVGLIHRHDGGLGPLGWLIGMREENDGLWGDLRITPSKVDDVTALLGDGIEQFSIEFRLTGNDHTHIDDSGIRWRQRVHLDRIALEPRGAYGEAARVTAFREALEEEKQRDEEAAREAENAASEAAAKAKEDAELEAVTQAALERRAEWDKLVGRLDDDMAKQEQLVKEYGVTQPGGIGSIRRS